MLRALPLLAIASVVQSTPERAAPVALQPSGSGFGDALALLRDVDGDGVPELAIGAPDDSSTAPRAGCVVVVSGLVGGDRFQLFRLDGPKAGYRLGTSVRSGADFDGDGLHDLIVGAEHRSSDGILCGISLRYYSSRDGRVLPGIPRGTRFPHVDFDSDGVADYLAANLDESAGIYSGRTHKALRVFPEQRPFGYLEGFGASVTWAGDVDGDGVLDVAVGCSESEDTGDEYYVALFSGKDAAVLRVLDSDNKYTVVGEGADFDRDGIPDLPVGLPEQETVVVLMGCDLRGPTPSKVVKRGDWPVLRTLRRVQFAPSGPPDALPTVPTPR